LRQWANICPTGACALISGKISFFYPEVLIFHSLRNVKISNPYSLEAGGIGRYLLAMGILCPVLFALLAFIEFEITTNRVRRFWRNFCRCCFKKKKINKDDGKFIEIPEDSDVLVSKFSNTITRLN